MKWLKGKETFGAMFGKHLLKMHKYLILKSTKKYFKMSKINEKNSFVLGNFKLK